jgi:hypothetical protein
VLENKVTNKILMVLIGVLLWAPFGFAKDIYVAHNSAGAINGADCTNAYSATWFNSSANWGSAATQINPGDTVHLCGSFAGTAGNTMLSVQGSGVAGRPITVLFETNAVLTAPYWPYATGAISCNNHAYITIDGGSNGLIQNTADGTALAYQQNSKGVDGGGTGCTNFTVKNLRISNLYIRTPLSTTDATDTAGISLIANNSIATKNTIDHSRVGIGLSFSNTSNGEISFNTETFVEHGITVGDTNNNSTLTGIKIHDNDLGGGAYLWDSGSANMWHHDPIHVFAVHSGSTTSGVQIYNNYVHGSWGNDQGYKATSGGTHITAALFIETIGSGAQIFNNVIALIGPLNQTDNGFIFLKGSGTVGQQSANARIYNNTLVSDNEGQGIGFSSNSGHDIRNNLMSGLAYAIYTPPGSSVATSDYNDFFGATNYGNFNTLSGWQGLGFDTHSKTTDPKLDSNFNLQSTSTILGLGVNLTSLGISSLNTDMQGAVRPASGPWDFGAFAHGGTQAARPNPPSGLAAIVQ